MKKVVEAYSQYFIQVTICISSALVTGCSSDSNFVGQNLPDNKSSSQEVNPIQGIDVSSASSAQCPAGGKVYSIFLDKNKNGAKDIDEVSLSEQIVCNGVPGSSGLSTLFSLNRVSTGFSACPSGAGLQINSGLDQNFSLSLEASEITQAQILCDGETGATGATGANGSNGAAGANGHSLVIKTIAASHDVCAAGGTTLLLALDINDNGIYDISAPQQQSVTLCNGQNGQNGQDGQTPAYSPVEPILACGNNVAYKEVLLRLQNGQVLGSFSNDVNGSMTRLAFLPDGYFMNTDNSGCTFSLATSNDGATRSISWFGQVQKSWPLH